MFCVCQTSLDFSAGNVCRMASSCGKKYQITFITMLHSFTRCLLASLIVEALLYERDKSFRNEAVVIERWQLFSQGQNQYSSEAFSVSFESPSFQKIRHHVSFANTHEKDCRDRTPCSKSELGAGTSPLLRDRQKRIELVDFCLLSGVERTEDKIYSWSECRSIQ